MLESGGLLSTKDLNQALQIFLLPRPAFKLWSSQHSLPALTVLFMPSDAHKNVTGRLNNHEALFPSWIKPCPGFSILNLNASFEPHSTWLLFHLLLCCCLLHWNRCIFKCTLLFYMYFGSEMISGSRWYELYQDGTKWIVLLTAVFWYTMHPLKYT